METIVVDCSGCKARLKIKAPPGRALTEIKCPKCGVKNPVSKGGVPAAEPRTPVPPAEITKPAPMPMASTEAPPVAPPPVSSSPEGEKMPATPVSPVAAVEQGLVAVKCDACQWQTKVMQAFIGKKIRCKQCSAIILVGTGTISAETSPPSPVTAPPLSPVMPREEKAGVPVMTPNIAPPVVPPAAPMAEPPPVVESGEPRTIALPTPSSATQALRLELENAKSKAKVAEDRASALEQRLQAAEKALHELMARHAGELEAANQRVAAFEKELDAFRSFAGEVATDDEREMASAEKRIAYLRERLARFTA